VFREFDRALEVGDGIAIGSVAPGQREVVLDLSPELGEFRAIDQLSACS
jgi:hypothetical protein